MRLQPHPAQRLVHELFALCARHSRRFKRERDVCCNVQVRKQRIVLKNGVHRPAVRRELRAIAAA